MGSDGARRGDRHPTASLSCSLSGGALAVEVPSLWTCGWTSLMGLKKEGQSAKRWPLLSVRVLLFRCHWMRRPQQAGGPDEVWSHHRPPPEGVPALSPGSHLHNKSVLDLLEEGAPGLWEQKMFIKESSVFMCIDQILLEQVPLHLSKNSCETEAFSYTPTLV